MTSLAVVVVSYNTREHLRACLATVPPSVDTVVVDNASTDGSAEMVRSDFPGVRVLADDSNPGYGAAANKGIRATQAEAVLVLNSDTQLKPDAIDCLSAYLERHPEVGVAAPRLLNPDGTLQPSCFPFPGTLAWLLENDPIAPLLRPVPWIRDRLLCYSPPGDAGPVPWVLGAALAIRRDAFDRVGGFDEGFFLYFEEVDLCLRLAREGMETHVVPEAAVVHVGGASTSQQRAHMAVEHFKSTLRFYRRHYRMPRRMTWHFLMRVKMAARLMRDGLALALAPQEERGRLRQDIAGWWRALFLAG